MVEVIDQAEKLALLGHNEISIEEGTEAEAKLYSQIETYANSEATLLKSLKETRYNLYVIAASLRKKYLNAKTGKYSEEFYDWYRRRNLNGFFGTHPNFTKYAAAGDLVNFVATKSKTPETDLEKLPSTLATLYELSLVKTELLNSKHERIFWQLFVSTPKRKFQTDKSIKLDKIPLIRNETVIRENGENEIRISTTEKDIKDWRTAWNNPAKSSSSRRADEEITVPVATIYAHKTLYDFNSRTGDHEGEVGLDDLTNLLQKLQSAFTAQNANVFRIKTEMVEIEERYKKRESGADPARKLFDKKKRKKKK